MRTANLSLFRKVQPSAYWSGTDYAPVPENAFGFRANNGGQDVTLKTDAWYAVAVRPGDVAAAVPEPQTLALALALLALGAAVMARRKRPD